VFSVAISQFFASLQAASERRTRDDGARRRVTDLAPIVARVQVAGVRLVELELRGVLRGPAWLARYATLPTSRPQTSRSPASQYSAASVVPR
jgi:hypothetical protein